MLSRIALKDLKITLTGMELTEKSLSTSVIILAKHSWAACNGEIWQQHVNFISSFRGKSEEQIAQVRIWVQLDALFIFF